jgi:hypothetical protein
VPFYRFTLIDGVPLENPVGLECKSDADAKIKAAFIARRIAIDLDWDNEDRRVIVFDERGIESRNTPVKPWPVT